MNVLLLIFTESGGFAGLKRGCTVVPAALPKRPREELQCLLQKPPDPSSHLGTGSVMPDMQMYTLELVTAKEAEQQTNRVLQYPASDVPDDLSELISFLRERAEPITLT
jgi:hypothetical protein